MIYTSYHQQPRRHPRPVNMLGQMMFMVRTTGYPMLVLSGARRIVVDIDPDRPLANVTTMELAHGLADAGSVDTSCSRSRLSR